MTDCVYADDAYLVAHFPAVVVRVPERWLVTVVVAEAGDYSVTAHTQVATYPAVVPPDGVAVVRNGLVDALGLNPWVSASLVGFNALQVLEVPLVLPPPGLALTAAGPTLDPPVVLVELLDGGDVSADFRDLWLEAAKCGLPPCCVVSCKSDYTLMHAALAAHLVFIMFNLGPTGQSAGIFDRMSLGPAALSKAKIAAYAGQSPIAGQTAPGDLFLEIRSRYVVGAMCA